MLAPLLIGFAFGWVLQRCGLSRYDRIANVFRLRDLTVIRFLLTALVTGAVAMALLEGHAPGVSVPIPATHAVGNLLGGAVFGIGMALSGFCPGTIAAGAGEGRLDNLVPGALGLLGGAVLFGLSYERLMPRLARRATTTTLAELVGASPYVTLVLVVELLSAVLLLLRGWHGTRLLVRSRKEAVHGERSDDPESLR